MGGAGVYIPVRTSATSQSIVYPAARSTSRLNRTSHDVFDSRVAFILMLSSWSPWKRPTGYPVADITLQDKSDKTSVSCMLDWQSRHRDDNSYSSTGIIKWNPMYVTTYLVTMSWIKRKGGRWRRLSLRGGFDISFPKIAWVKAQLSADILKLINFRQPGKHARKVSA